jgi:hypothetical protein
VTTNDDDPRMIMMIDVSDEINEITDETISLMMNKIKDFNACINEQDHESQ